MILLCINSPLDLLLYDIVGFWIFMFYKVVEQIVGVVYMPISSTFLTQSTGEKIVTIGQYLAKVWTKYDSIVFLATCIRSIFMSQNADTSTALQTFIFII